MAMVCMCVAVLPTIAGPKGKGAAKIDECQRAELRRGFSEWHGRPARGFERSLRHGQNAHAQTILIQKPKSHERIRTLIHGFLAPEFTPLSGSASPPAILE